MTPPLDDSSLRNQIGDWLTAGVAVPEVEGRLVERGVKPEEASRIVDAILGQQVATQSATQTRKSRRSMLWGGTLCALGSSFMVVGVLAFTQPQLGLPAHVGVFVAGVGALGAGVMQLLGGRF